MQKLRSRGMLSWKTMSEGESDGMRPERERAGEKRTFSLIHFGNGFGFYSE